ncbi:hypothetical protein IL306_004990 [Fusarium sp. DS 682]|nr:hypothetical protein IL306_004990 [Fusarium sp. DS 682]
MAEVATSTETTTIAVSNSTKKPHLVFGATPVDGHTYPLIQIAEDLIRRGFEVTFIGDGQFESAVTEAGAKHVTVPPLLNPKLMAEREAIPAGIPRLLYDIRHIFTGQTPERWRILRGVLKNVRAEDPEREVVVMPETCFMGANPISLGAPLPRDIRNDPSLEYSRSDMPSNVKFAGCATPKTIPSDFVYPSWWDNVKRGDRRIIAMTQGTIARNATNLIIPTIKALSDRDDLLVVAILGRRSAFLPDNVTIPSNTRIIDYLPYDILLPHASAFVMNAGYGGFLNGVTNGVPLVLAGETEDKPEIAMRGEWSGVAVNLETGRPTPDMVREGVERVLADGSFKRRVDEIKAENEAMKFFDFIEEQVLSVGNLET